MAASSRTGADASLAQRIDACLDTPGLRGGIHGILIQLISDGRTVYERNADTLLLPASNEKLITSSAILEALGPDWKFTTTALRRGDVDGEGTLHGDLILKGMGDPLLAPADLDEMADSLKRAGIRKVAGTLIGDDSRFDHNSLGPGWEWDDLAGSDACEVSGLNLNENSLSVVCAPGRRVGDRVKVTVSPADKTVRMTIRATTTPKATASTLRIDRMLGRNEILVEGSLPVDAKPDQTRPVTVSVRDPTRFATTYLADRMRRAGIELNGLVGTGSVPASDAIEVARHESPPLADVLKRLNKPSDNFIAECLLKTLGAEKSSDGIGTWPGGGTAAMAWMRSLGTDAVRVADGSGLSRHNWVSARAIVILLRAMKTRPDGRMWLDSLPIAGVDGTLRNRMKGTPAENNCRAKTGSMTRVSCLSGYVTTKAGEALAFSILMNNYPGTAADARMAQDTIVEMLAAWDRSL